MKVALWRERERDGKEGERRQEGEEEEEEVVREEKEVEEISIDPAFVFWLCQWCEEGEEDRAEGE